MRVEYKFGFWQKAFWFEDKNSEISIDNRIVIYTNKDNCLQKQLKWLVMNVKSCFNKGNQESNC